MKELFLLCALALPVASIHVGEEGGYHSPDTAKDFFREYHYIHGFLERKYPGHEFLIIPEQLHKRQPPWPWEELSWQWRGHFIYKRPTPPKLGVAVFRESA